MSDHRRTSRLANAFLFAVAAAAGWGAGEALFEKHDKGENQIATEMGIAAISAGIINYVVGSKYHPD
jgi:hypothetical protein